MVYFFPRTKLGKISLILIMIFFALFVFMNLLVAFGMRGGKTFFSNIPLALTGIAIVLSGILAFIFGIASIFKKERAVFVFLAAVMGFLVLIFVIGEIVFPH